MVRSPVTNKPACHYIIAAFKQTYFRSRQIKGLKGSELGLDVMTQLLEILEACNLSILDELTT